MAAGGVGLTLTDIELGMVLVSDTKVLADLTDDIGYSALKARVGEAEVFGIEGLVLTVSDFNLEVNSAKNAAGVEQSVVLDFNDGTVLNALAFDVSTGPTTPDVTLDFEGAEGNLVQVAGELELDVFGAEAVEEPPALAEQHRHEMELDLVEHAGRERELRDPGAVDQHVPVARGGLASAIAVRTSSTYVTSGHSLDRFWRLRMKIGTPS